jgi:hypothetical protein
VVKTSWRRLDFNRLTKEPGSSEGLPFRLAVSFYGVVMFLTALAFVIPRSRLFRRPQLLQRHVDRAVFRPGILKGGRTSLAGLFRHHRRASHFGSCRTSDVITTRVPTWNTAGLP